MLALVILTPATGFAQSTPEATARPQVRTVVAGAHYAEPPGGQEWLLGSGYRDLWTEPFEVEILDLRAFGDGLTPVMRVGGMQTLGLAMRGGDGRDYTFRSGRDVVRGRDIPAGFVAVLAGHIHRHQVLTTDLAGRPLAAPVLYPGSIERTSSAERSEPKGFLRLEIDPDPATGGTLRCSVFHELPARPLVDLELADHDRARLASRLGEALAELDPEAVVRVRLGGTALLGAAEVRALAPPTMTVTLHRPRPGARR